MRTTLLDVAPIPLLVPARVFDAFGWCESRALEWRTREPFDDRAAIDGSDPARMVFVFRDEDVGLPRELARLHAFGLGLTEEWALAPYGIDDATDGLHEQRRAPHEVFWLAADNLNALFWGLHDWAHFHNHGPFVERAWNELQCDASALAWMWRNRAQIPLEDARWGGVASAVLALAQRRFDEEGVEAGASMPDLRLLRELGEAPAG